MIKLQQVSKKISPNFFIEDINVGFSSCQTAAIVGESGSGKSTLLKIISGLIKVDAGEVLFDDQILTPESVDAIRLKIGYVIQSSGLFPHLSIFDNICLVGNYLKKSPAFCSNRIDELLSIIPLSRSLLNRYPHQISGGQKQRAALMRALFLDPPFLLLDEPLGALDPIIRYDLQLELKHMFQKLEKTVIFVTHDLREANFLASKIIMMHDGHIIQQGTFAELKNSPSNPYISKFFSTIDFNHRLV